MEMTEGRKDGNEGGTGWQGMINISNCRVK